MHGVIRKLDDAEYTSSSQMSLAECGEEKVADFLWTGLFCFD